MITSTIHTELDDLQSRFASLASTSSVASVSSSSSVFADIKREHASEAVAIRCALANIGAIAGFTGSIQSALAFAKADAVMAGDLEPLAGNDHPSLLVPPTLARNYRATGGGMSAPSLPNAKKTRRRRHGEHGRMEDVAHSPAVRL